MSVSVSKYVRTQVVNLLSDETVGFNPTLASIVTDVLPGFEIDFSPNTKNFLQGWYAVKDVIATSTMKFPLMCLYTMKSQNTNDEKFCTFAGSIMVALDTYLSFPRSQAQNNTDDLVDAVEGTLYTVFNSADNQSFYNQALYNGDITVKRGPIYQGGQNWIQPINTVLTFDLIAA